MRGVSSCAFISLPASPSSTPASLSGHDVTRSHFGASAASAMTVPPGKTVDSNLRLDGHVVPGLAPAPVPALSAVIVGSSSELVVAVDGVPVAVAVAVSALTTMHSLQVATTTLGLTLTATLTVVSVAEQAGHLLQHLAVVASGGPGGEASLSASPDIGGHTHAVTKVSVVVDTIKASAMLPA